MNGKRKNFTAQDFLEIGKAMSIKKVKDIVNSINDVVLQWPKYASQVGVEKEKTNLIKENLIQIHI